MILAATSCGAPGPHGTITLDSLFTIGDSIGPGMLPGYPRSMARDGRGRFILTFPWGRSEEPPYVFDRDGRFLAHLGSLGDGPGEFRRPETVFVGGEDSLFILDRSVLRLTVYDSDLRFVRTATVPPFGDAVRLPGGDFFISTLGDGPTGFVLQRLDPTGRAGTRFGAMISPCSPLMCGSSDPRRLSLTPGGEVLATWRILRYRIERWDTAGVERANLTPRADGFGPYDEPSDPAPDTPPNPAVSAVGADSAGLLWVLGKAVNPQWRDALGGTFVSEGQRLHRVTGRLYDGIVEVLEPRRGARLAQHRFAGEPWFWLPGNLVATVHQAEAGTVHLILYHATYRPP